MKNEIKRLFFSMTYEFLDIYMKTQMGKSSDTIKSYRDALTVFRKYLLDECKISIANFTFEQCTRNLVLDFMEYLKNRNNKPGTRNQRLTVIKTYLWFASDKDITLQSIALVVSNIRSYRNPVTDKPVIPENALALLLQEPPNSPMGIRDRTIMIILYDSAARLAEILNLKVKDIYTNKNNPYIRVLGKGNKERVIAITSQTAEHINQYLKNYHAAGSPKPDLLFYTVIKNHIGKMSEGNVERFLQKYADQVRKVCPDMPERVYPHMFRRTRATNLYQNGVELPLVSRILGHAQLETTRIYAKPSLDMMRNALKTSAPPNVENEAPLWNEDTEDQMAKSCGLR